METPSCEVAIDGNKFQPPKWLLLSPEFKEFTEDDLNIAKSMMRLHHIEAEEDKTRIEMKGVQLEVSECKYSIEKLFARMNAAEVTFNEWHMKGNDLKKEIDNLKKVNDERVKEIEKLKCGDKGVREGVSGCKRSLKNLLERINTNESNFYELCQEKNHLKNEIDNLKKVNDERVKVIEKLTSENVALKNTQGFSKEKITEEF